MIYMKTSYIAHLPLVVLHTAFIRPPSFLVLQKNNNQNGNLNIQGGFFHWSALKMTKGRVQIIKMEI